MVRVIDVSNLHIDIDEIADSTLDNNSKMIAICFNKSNILSGGCTTSAINIRFFNQKLKAPAEHCEINALKQLIRPRNVKLFNYSKKLVNKLRVDMIVIRKNAKGEYTNSKPCKHCTDFLKSESVTNYINLRRIIYYDEEYNSFVCTSLNDLQTDHISIGYKRMFSKNKDLLMWT